MSTVMTSDNSTGAPGPATHRRSREEMEALAKNFVGSPAPVAPPAGKPRTLMVGGVVAAVVVAAAVAFFALRSGGKADRQQSAAASRAAEQVEELRQRMEAERERTRKELEGGSDYLNRIAAADAALVKDLSASADRLAARQAAADSAASAQELPTPRDESQRVAATRSAPATSAAAAPKPAASQPAKASTATAKPDPAATQATTVAQASKSSCQIHVSELSDSGTLTYEDIKKMKGARLDEATGHVFTPPVPGARGRQVVFEVAPDGCVKVARR